MNNKLDTWTQHCLLFYILSCSNIVCDTMRTQKAIYERGDGCRWCGVVLVENMPEDTIENGWSIYHRKFWVANRRKFSCSLQTFISLHNDLKSGSAQTLKRSHRIWFVFVTFSNELRIPREVHFSSLLNFLNNTIERAVLERNWPRRDGWLGVVWGSRQSSLIFLKQTTKNEAFDVSHSTTNEFTEKL